MAKPTGSRRSRVALLESDGIEFRESASETSRNHNNNMATSGGEGSLSSGASSSGCSSVESPPSASSRSGSSSGSESSMTAKTSEDYLEVNELLYLKTLEAKYTNDNNSNDKSSSWIAEGGVSRRANTTIAPESADSGENFSSSSSSPSRKGMSEFSAIDLRNRLNNTNLRHRLPLPSKAPLRLDREHYWSQSETVVDRSTVRRSSKGVKSAHSAKHHGYCCCCLEADGCCDATTEKQRTCTNLGESGPMRTRCSAVTCLTPTITTTVTAAATNGQSRSTSRGKSNLVVTQCCQRVGPSSHQTAQCGQATKAASIPLELPTWPSNGAASSWSATLAARRHQHHRPSLSSPPQDAPPSARARRQGKFCPVLVKVSRSRDEEEDRVAHAATVEPSTSRATSCKGVATFLRPSHLCRPQARRSFPVPPPVVPLYKEMALFGGSTGQLIEAASTSETATHTDPKVNRTSVEHSSNEDLVPPRRSHTKSMVNIVNFAESGAMRCADDDNDDGVIGFKKSQFYCDNWRDLHKELETSGSSNWLNGYATTTTCSGHLIRRSSQSCAIIPQACCSQQRSIGKKSGKSGGILERLKQSFLANFGGGGGGDSINSSIFHSQPEVRFPRTSDCLPAGSLWNGGSCESGSEQEEREKQTSARSATMINLMPLRQQPIYDTPEYNAQNRTEADKLSAAVEARRPAKPAVRPTMPPPPPPPLSADVASNRLPGQQQQRPAHLNDTRSALDALRTSLPHARATLESDCVGGGKPGKRGGASEEEEEASLERRAHSNTTTGSVGEKSNKINVLQVSSIKAAESSLSIHHLNSIKSKQQLVIGETCVENQFGSSLTSKTSLKAKEELGRESEDRQQISGNLLNSTTSDSYHSFCSPSNLVNQTNDYLDEGEQQQHDEEEEEEQQCNKLKTSTRKKKKSVNWALTTGMIAKVIEDKLTSYRQEVESEQISSSSCFLDNHNKQNYCGRYSEVVESGRARASRGSKGQCKSFVPVKAKGEPNNNNNKIKDKTTLIVDGVRTSSAANVTSRVLLDQLAPQLQPRDRLTTVSCATSRGGGGSGSIQSRGTNTFGTNTLVKQSNNLQHLPSSIIEHLSVLNNNNHRDKSEFKDRGKGNSSDSDSDSEIENRLKKGSLIKQKSNKSLAYIMGASQSASTRGEERERKKLEAASGGKNPFLDQGGKLKKACVTPIKSVSKTSHKLIGGAKITGSTSISVSVSSSSSSSSSSSTGGHLNTIAAATTISGRQSPSFIMSPISGGERTTLEDRLEVRRRSIENNDVFIHPALYKHVNLCHQCSRDSRVCNCNNDDFIDIQIEPRSMVYPHTTTGPLIDDNNNNNQRTPTLAPSESSSKELAANETANLADDEQTTSTGWQEKEQQQQFKTVLQIRIFNTSIGQQNDLPGSSSPKINLQDINAHSTPVVSQSAPSPLNNPPALVVLALNQCLSSGIQPVGSLSRSTDDCTSYGHNDNNTPSSLSTETGEKGEAGLVKSRSTTSIATILMNDAMVLPPSGATSEREISGTANGLVMNLKPEKSECQSCNLMRNTHPFNCINDDDSMNRRIQSPQTLIINSNNINCDRGSQNNPLSLSPTQDYDEDEFRSSSLSHQCNSLKSRTKVTAISVGSHQATVDCEFKDQYDEIIDSNSSNNEKLVNKGEGQTITMTRAHQHADIVNGEDRIINCDDAIDNSDDEQVTCKLNVANSIGVTSALVCIDNGIQLPQSSIVVNKADTMLDANQSQSHASIIPILTEGSISSTRRSSLIKLSRQAIHEDDEDRSGDNSFRGARIFQHHRLTRPISIKGPLNPNSSQDDSATNIVLGYSPILTSVRDYIQNVNTELQVQASLSASSATGAIEPSSNSGLANIEGVRSSPVSCPPCSSSASSTLTTSTTTTEVASLAVEVSSLKPVVTIANEPSKPTITFATANTTTGAGVGNGGPKLVHKMVKLKPPKKSLFKGASKEEILEYLSEAKKRVPKLLLAADDVMVINENEVIVVDQLEPGSPATPISIVEATPVIKTISTRSSSMSKNRVDIIHPDKLRQHLQQMYKTQLSQFSSVAKDTGDVSGVSNGRVTNSKLDSNCNSIGVSSSTSVVRLCSDLKGFSGIAETTLGSDLNDQVVTCGRNIILNGVCEETQTPNDDDNDNKRLLLSDKNTVHSELHQQQRRKSVKTLDTSSESEPSSSGRLVNFAPSTVFCIGRRNTLSESSSQILDCGDKNSTIQLVLLHKKSANRDSLSSSSSSPPSSTSPASSDSSNQTSGNFSAASNFYLSSSLVCSSPSLDCTSSSLNESNSPASGTAPQQQQLVVVDANTNLMYNQSSPHNAQVSDSLIKQMKEDIFHKIVDVGNLIQVDKDDSGSGAESSIQANNNSGEGGSADIIQEPNKIVTVEQSRDITDSNTESNESNQGGKLSIIDEVGGQNIMSGDGSVDGGKSTSPDPTFLSSANLMSSTSYGHYTTMSRLNTYFMNRHPLGDGEESTIEFQCLDCDQIIDIDHATLLNMTAELQERLLRETEHNNNVDSDPSQQIMTPDQLDRAYVAAMNGLPVCKSCEKKRVERTAIISEFVDTELTYGRDLQIIHDEFYRPLEISKLLNHDQCSGVFLNIEELIIGHCRYAHRLEKAMTKAYALGDTEYNTVDIGRLFVESAEMLHGFESYCMRHGLAACLLSKLSKEKELVKVFLTVSQMENETLRRMNLAAFLMVPVQRVTRYPLLLNRLYKATAYHHKDREALRDAQLKVELHLEHINNQTKSVGTTTKILRKIYCNISNLTVPLLLSNRRALIDAEDIGYIKLKKTAIELLKWDRDETQFVHSGRLNYAPLSESLVKHKIKPLKYMAAHAMLIVLGKTNSNYRPDVVKSSDPDSEIMIPSPDGSGIKETALLLFKEKNGRFVPCREPLLLSNCVLSTEFKHLYNSKCPLNKSNKHSSILSLLKTVATNKKVTKLTAGPNDTPCKLNSRSSSNSATSAGSSHNQQQQTTANPAFDVWPQPLQPTGSSSAFKASVDSTEQRANSINGNNAVSMLSLKSFPEDQGSALSASPFAPSSRSYSLASTLPKNTTNNSTSNLTKLNCKTTSNLSMLNQLMSKVGNYHRNKPEQPQQQKAATSSGTKGPSTSQLEMNPKFVQATTSNHTTTDPLLTNNTTTNNIRVPLASLISISSQGNITGGVPVNLLPLIIHKDIVQQHNNQHLVNKDPPEPSCDCEESFEIHDRILHDSLSLKADAPLTTRYWLRMIRYHAKDLGQWRTRRDGLSNVMVVHKK